MKKSNKILLAGLLTTILVLVAVHVALYARYKAGNYVPFSEKEAEEATKVNEFASSKSIHIRHMTNVVVRIGDRMRVEQFGENNGDVGVKEQGGRVELSLKDSIGDERFFDYVVVYVPEGSTISTHKSMVRFEGQEGKRIGYLNILASGGYLGFEQSKNMVQIDSLNVEVSNQGTIELKNAHVTKLSVQLTASELIDQGAVIQQLKLNADSASRINLQYKNLSNLIN